MSTAGATDQGFFAFFREYTHTGIHAASTAGLTAFGLLTFVHRAFVVLAIAVYVLPPIYLYLTRDEGSVETVEPSESSSVGNERNATDGAASSDASETAETTEPARTTETTEPSGSADGTVLGGDSTATTEPIEPRTPDATDAAATDDGDRARASTDTGSTVEDETNERAAETEGSEGGADGTTKPGSREPRERATEAHREDENRGAADGAERSEEAERFDENERSEGAAETVVPESTDDRAAEPDETAEEESGEEPATLGWVEADSPTDEALSDVVATDSTAYAVGSGGVLLVRDGDWETVLEHGPSAESNALVGVDVVDDEGAAWFTGDSGALGRYDAETARHTDHSVPAGITDNWVDVAVAGPAGEERVYLVNGSGQVLAGEFDGSEVEWGEAIKPGSGSSMSAIEFVEGAGYCCDTNSGVYETTDGEEFERIGIDGGGSFTAIAAADPETLAVAAADGSIQRYDGGVWTRLHAADVALDALSTDGTDWLAAGDGGAIRELADGSWEPRETPVETNLHGVAVGEPSVAVGAEGTIIELRPVEGGD